MNKRYDGSKTCTLTETLEGSRKTHDRHLTNSRRETVKTGYKYTRECTYYVGLKVSGEELNTYENWKHMAVMQT